MLFLPDKCFSETLKMPVKNIHAHTHLQIFPEVLFTFSIANGPTSLIYVGQDCKDFHQLKYTCGVD